MGHFHAIPDAVAVAADRLVAVVRVGSDGAVVVRDLANGTLSTISASELCGPPAPSDPTVAPVLSLMQATDAQWERARRREAVIAELVNASDVSDQVTRASVGLGVSRRTVFRWLAAYRDAPQTSSLLARARGTPTGARRIDADLEQLIAEVIRDVYLTKVRAKKEEVVRQVGLKCSAERLAPPSRKAILARVRALDTRAVAKARLQASEAASLVDSVPGTYRVDNALEVVQIDHTPVDVIVVDEVYRLPIGRPWLTLAIDVATRVVVGFYVSLEAPSSTSVALCLTQAVLPKEPWLKARALACARRAKQSRHSLRRPCPQVDPAPE